MGQFSDPLTGDLVQPNLITLYYNVIKLN
jgi:hypothetical protein